MELFWIRSSSAGRLATATRPRGGEWVEAELRGLRGDGVDELVSMLTAPEQRELGLVDEAVAAERAGLAFTSVPIADRDVPERTMPFVDAVRASATAMQTGRAVAVHCRMGIGRSSMFAAGCLLAAGVAPAEAWAAITAARGRPVPDVPVQREWIDALVRLLRLDDLTLHNAKGTP